jgi:hypothetical protein
VRKIDINLFQHRSQSSPNPPLSALEHFQLHLIPLYPVNTMSATQSSFVDNEGPFDPAIHLAPLPADKANNGKIMMSDLGFPDSPVTKVSAANSLIVTDNDGT